MVCKLHKALCGSKQDRNVWNTRLYKFIAQTGQRHLQYYQCVYYYRHSESNTLIVAVFFNDITIFSNLIDLINKFREGLKQEFTTKDLGKIRTICGITVTKNREGGSIRYYILNILHDSILLNATRLIHQ